MKILPVLVSLAISFCAGAQSVGLVLSGGGAKGLSHVGVIKALEEHDIPIDYVSGTSMGAIVGGLYAIGLSPDEMIYLFKSEEFQAWYMGKSEKEFASYLYDGEPNPAMVNLGFKFKEEKDGKRKLALSFPTSIISPYPMDIAVVQLFSSSSAAAQNDFSKLMVPFFCVSSDILKKQPYICEKGDLGSAIRSSMTFPGYFKPIVIDSTLLYDGGIYNNFPWKIMDEKFHPDYIIGAKCVLGKQLSAEEDDLLKQIESMISIDTDYDIPEDKGMVIAGEYKFTLLEFDKVDEIVQLGYENTLKCIPQLKEKIKKERMIEEVSARRVAFRLKCSELKFNSIEVEGNFNDKERQYITNTVSDKEPVFDFIQAKRGYYRVAASNTVQTLYPTASFNKDSLFTLKFRASKKKEITLSVGGNISSSSLNQGFVGLSYINLDKYPWRISANLDIGQYYTGVGLYWRQDFSIKPLVFYEVMMNIHRFDYFLSSQSILFSNSLSNNITESETYLTLNFGIPISPKRNLILKVGATAGRNYYDYYPSKSYTKYDTPDKTRLTFVNTKAMLEKSTFNYKLYPTEGTKTSFEARYMISWETTEPGSLTESQGTGSYTKNSFLARFYHETYLRFNKWFTLGCLADVTYSTRVDMCDYTSSILVMPAFQPTVHSKTVLLGNYRAPIYAGIAISPIFSFGSSFYASLTGAYFQPYRQIRELANGKYEYSSPFPLGSFMASLAFVWQSPVGPISLSCSYYDKAETKWYPQLNIGFLIFRNHSLRN